MPDTFSTDGACPAGGLIPCLDRAVAGLPYITTDQIPSFLALVDKWSDVLFKSYPDWFHPLFTSSVGNQALLKLPQLTFTKITNKVSKEPLIQFCLFFQSSLRPHPTDQDLRNNKLWSDVFDKTPLLKLYEAIAHYVHPNQEAAFTSLQSQFPIHPTFSPLHQQYTIPSQARPQLFPAIDTTLFSPQFDWFVHLLSKYSPDESFAQLLCDIVTTASDFNSPTLLKPNFSIPDTFIHTHMFNSFDEFLSSKLPDITSRLNLSPPDDPTPAIGNPPLFSYFSKPHPCLPTPDSRTPTEYAAIAADIEFHSYFVYSFLFGPSLFSQQRPHFYTSIDFGRYASQFDFTIHVMSTALEIQLAAFFYRTYLLTTDIQHLTDHFQTATATTLVPSQPPIHTTPPTFTHPYFPLQLSLVGYSRIAMPIACAVKDDFLTTSQIITNLSHHGRSLAPVLLHILHNIPTDPHPVDTHILDLFSQPDFYSQLTTQAQLDDPSHNLDIFVSYFIIRSHQRYLEGKDTLHQYLYHTMQTHPKLAQTLEQPNAFHSFLLHPFIYYYIYTIHPLLTKHLFLTIHAGFLNFTPPPPTSPSLDLYQALAPIRSTIVSCLVNITNLDSFFPSSERFQHQTVYQLIPYVTNFKHLHFTSKHTNLLRVLIPWTHDRMDKDVSTSFPTTQSLLYDDHGHIHAIAMDLAQDDTSKSMGSDYDHIYAEHGYQAKKNFHTNAFSTLQSPFAPSNFTPHISTSDQDRISSDENVVAIQSTQTTLVQNHLIKYFKALAVSDTQQVQSKLQQVLLKSDLLGLISSLPSR